MKELPVFLLDGAEVPYRPGQSVLQAALAAGHYIPHLCYHPDFQPHGSCRVCTAKVNGHTVASCTTMADSAVEVESDHIRAWLDGVLYIDYVDTFEPFLTGTVGFKTFKADTVTFDDLLVTPLE